MLKFLKSPPVLAITAIFLVQAGMLYSTVRTEVIPGARSLAEFPKQIGDARFLSEGVIDPEQLDMLKADDILSRNYFSVKANLPEYLFVAAFRSQRNGKAPHSPKNCLPGSGWTPLVSDKLPIDIGAGRSIEVNRYIVAHGDERSLVLYWYQSRERVVADEFKAKFYVMVDAVKLNRTDTALVKVVIPIVNKDETHALEAAKDFVRSFFDPLKTFLPA